LCCLRYLHAFGTATLCDFCALEHPDPRDCGVFF